MSKINWKKIAKNIPNIINVGNKVDYEIVSIDEFKDGETRGEARFETKQIVLLNSMKPKEKVSTLLHELYHIYSEETGIDLTEKQVLGLESKSHYLIKTMLTLLGEGNVKK